MKDTTFPKRSVAYALARTTAGDAEARFGRKTWRAGVGLWRQHAVGSLTWNGVHEVSSTVRHDDDAWNTQATTEHADGRWWVTSTCSCPEGDNCVHGAALLRLLLREYEQRRIKGSVVDGLLGQLDRAQLSGVPSEAPKYALLYLVAPPRTDDALIEIRVIRAYLKIDGAYGKTSPYDFRDFAKNRHRDYVTSEDEAVLSLALAAETPSQLASPGFVQCQGGLVNELLTRVVGTGRAYWQSLENHPLEWGAELNAKLAWQLEEDGCQRLRLVGEDTETFRLVSTEPPLYMDERHNALGPVKIPLPKSMCDCVTEWPALNSEQAEELSSALDANPIYSSLPRPTAVWVAESLAPRPTPYLQILTPKSGLESLYPLAAEVGFAYGDNLVPQGDGPIEFGRGEVLHKLTRRHDDEQQAIATLNGLGWTQGGSRAARAFGIQSEYRESFLVWPEVEIDEPMSTSEMVTHAVVPLERAGWRVRYPEDARPKSSKVGHPVFSQKRADDAPGWFEVALDVEVEGQTIPLLPVLLAALQDEASALSQWLGGREPDARFVTVTLENGREIELPVERIRPLTNILFELYRNSAQGTEKYVVPESLAYMTGDEEGSSIEALTQRAFDSLSLPEWFEGTLLPYQETGIAWLNALSKNGFGGVLADDMGLGKTIQTIAYVAASRGANSSCDPVLILCPRTLLGNWQQEFQRFAPSLHVSVYHGTERGFESLQDGSDVYITTYQTVVRDQEILSSCRFSSIFLDESQSIKNDASKAYRAACRLQATFRCALTGTPVENNLGELWSQFSFVMPGLLGTKEQFGRFFRTPIEQGEDAAVGEALAERIKPFVLRRRKDDVARELPRKTEVIRTVSLNGAQRELYETLRLAMHEKVRDELKRQGLGGRSSMVLLDALLKLRQVCCDPRLVPLDAASAVEESAKLEFLLEMLPPLVEEGRRILVFSQFTSMLELIEVGLKELSIDYLKLTGESQDRQGLVDRFQNGDAPVFLMSLKAGGVGLNLTAADTVVHYDPWWNPAVTQQATDRAHRIGQDRPVFVYHLVAQGSVEERVLSLQRDKQELADLVLDGAPSRSISEADIDTFFAPLRKPSGRPRAD